MPLVVKTETTTALVFVAVVIMESFSLTRCHHDLFRRFETNMIAEVAAIQCQCQ